LSGGGGRLARRLLALSGLQGEPCRAAVDGVGAAAPRPRGGGRGGGCASARADPPLPRIRAVARGRAVERGTTGSRRGGCSAGGGSPLHGRGGQRRRVGAAARVRS